MIGPTDLLRLAADLRARRTLGPGDAAALADWLEQRVPAAPTPSLADRDALLSAAMRQFWPGLPVRQQAAALAAAALRYQTTRWRLDRTQGRMPTDLAARPEGVVWRVLVDHGAFPGVETLRKLQRP